jgi:glycosyltransferase EpsF
MKVFHIVENLDKGAVENWLVTIFLTSRKSRPDWEWTFYCILGQEGRLDQQVMAAGGRIIYSPYPISRKRRFLRHLRRVVRDGHYDILHVHHDYLSGFYLLATIGIRFSKRILHIHNTDEAVPVGSPALRRMLLGPMRYSAIQLSDVIVGISRDSLSFFLKDATLKRKRSTVLYYGIDLARFGAVNREHGWLRKELELPDDVKILLFTGRMNETKNPSFVVEILRVLIERRKNVCAIFVGKGSEEDIIREKSRKYGLEDRVRLPGWRNDIAGIMQEADVFVFPRVEHPKEGLGLVVVEAQSAGLPMVLSNGIVRDAIVIDELAHFVPLRDNPAEWASVIETILNEPKPISMEQAILRMMQSPFELTNATLNLISLYEQIEIPAYRR